MRTNRNGVAKKAEAASTGLIIFLSARNDTEDVYENGCTCCLSVSAFLAQSAKREQDTEGEWGEEEDLSLGF